MSYVLDLHYIMSTRVSCLDNEELHVEKFSETNSYGIFPQVSCSGLSISDSISDILRFHAKMVSC